MCRARARRRPASPRSTSCRPTRTPLGASPEGDRGRARSWPARLEFYPDGSATRLREAIAAVHGLNPANIVCSNGSDEITRPAGADLSGARRRRRSSPSTASWSTRSTSRRPAAMPVIGQGDRRTRRRRRDPRRGDAADQDRLPRQSQQSDRHLSAVRGGAPAACRPAEARASGARRGLCRICPPQRLRSRHRAGRRRRRTSS